MLRRHVIFVFAAIGLLVFAAPHARAADVKAADAKAEDAALDARVARLIKKLGDDRFAVRERAQAELAEIGEDAFDALSIAQHNTDIEVAMRARYLARLIRVKWQRDHDPATVKTLLKDYGSLSESDRLARAADLTALSDFSGVEALCRLVRFDVSETISKAVALHIINDQIVDTSNKDAMKKRRQVILKAVRRSHRPGAEWLRIYVEDDRDPAAAVRRWAAAIKIEQKLLTTKPRSTSRSVVKSLLQRQVTLLEGLSRHDEAQQALLAMLDLQTGDPDSLERLVLWLVKRKAWRVIEKAAEKHAEVFEHDPALLYALAHVHSVREQTDQANVVAKKAFGLKQDDRTLHMALGRKQYQTGHFDWAEREFRHVIRGGEVFAPHTINAQFHLSTMLHDLGSELAAAMVLKKALENLEKTAKERGDDSLNIRILRGITNDMKSRMEFYFACEHLRSGDRAKQTASLLKAIKADPTDADVLIALYRLPEPSEELRKDIMRRIKGMARVYHDKIGSEKKREAFHCNQYAWLVGNTLAEINPKAADEAIRQSHRSLELRPNTAGYLDTLGRCYFGKGDLVNAVKYQAEAARLDPHSGLIQRQLKEFKKALEQRGVPKKNGN